MKRIIVCLLVLSFFCWGWPNFVAAQTYPPLTDFVRREGAQLMLNGVPYKFIGVNRDNAPTENAREACGDGGENPELYLSTMFNHLRNTCALDNTNMVMRIWAYQSYTHYNPSTGEIDYSQIDRVIQKAKQYGIRLVMTLENQWGDCTKCQNDSGNCRKLNTWYKDGYKLWKASNPNNHGYDYPLTYREYVQHIVTRYKDEKIILMWQLMNEAESETVDYHSDHQSMYDFTADMANLIKAIDQNHLVNIGTIGNENPGIDYDNLHAIANIDILESHDYGLPVYTNPSLHRDYVENNLAVSRQLNKPIFLGESGIHRSDAQPLSNRAALFDEKMSAYFNQGGNGYLIWSYTEGDLDPYYHLAEYDFESDDPLCYDTLKNFPLALFPTSSPSPTPIPGDANGDNRVDEADYQVWWAHYLQTVGGGPAQGDFDYNQVVDGVDFVIWLNHI